MKLDKISPLLTFLETYRDELRSVFGQECDLALAPPSEPYIEVAEEDGHRCLAVVSTRVPDEREPDGRFETAFTIVPWVLREIEEHPEAFAAQLARWIEEAAQSEVARRVRAFAHEARSQGAEISTTATLRPHETRYEA